MPVTAIEAPSAAKSSFNPITGVFGTGQIQLIFKDGNFIAPVTGKYRIRVWGAGGRFGADTGGAGGGFAMKVVELNEGDIIPVTVALSLNGNATSFGAYVSATSGETATATNQNSDGGIGIGGDINHTGGKGGYSTTSEDRRAGGAASIFGDGGDGHLPYTSVFDNGGSGSSGNNNVKSLGHSLDFRECMIYGLDFIGAGKGATNNDHAASGGAPNTNNSCYATAGFPAAGGTWLSPNSLGANGLVTVEY